MKAWILGAVGLGYLALCVHASSTNIRVFEAVAKSHAAYCAELSRIGFYEAPPSALSRVLAWCVRHGILEYHGSEA